MRVAMDVVQVLCTALISTSATLTELAACMSWLEGNVQRSAEDLDECVPRMMHCTGEDDGSISASHKKEAVAWYLLGVFSSRRC